MAIDSKRPNWAPAWGRMRNKQNGDQLLGLTSAKRVAVLVAQLYHKQALEVDVEILPLSSLH